MSIDRRAMLALLAGSAAARALPAFAESKEVFVATYPGSLDEAFKAVVGPQVRQKFAASPAFSPMLNTDLIGRLQAARANPPFDLALWDNGPIIIAKQDGLLEKFAAKSCSHCADIPPQLIDPDGYGPVFALTAIGLAYNPTKIKTPPTSWLDLWKPEYKGRVGITNLNSTLGTGWLVEIARTRGGNEGNVEAGFKAIEELKPNLAAVAANPGQLATLYQQGQIDIGPGNFNAIQILKARGVPVEFVAPKEGAIAFKTTIHIVKNSPNKDLAFRLIEAALTPEVQTALMNPPYLIVPTNAKVQMTGEIAKVLAKDTEDLKKKFVFQDWKKINEQRSAWIERFNREIKI